MPLLNSGARSSYVSTSRPIQYLMSLNSPSPRTPGALTSLDKRTNPSGLGDGTRVGVSDGEYVSAVVERSRTIGQFAVTRTRSITLISPLA